MSEQLGEKHSAPAPSPSREQGKKKKAKQQQTTLSFMPRTKAKDLDPKLEMFKCVEKLIKETNGESLEPLANDYKEKLEFFQSSIKLCFVRMEIEEDDDIIEKIAIDTDELVAKKDELIAKRKIDHQNIADIKNAREHAKEGFDYFKLNQKAVIFSKFQKIMRNADTLLTKIIAQEEALKIQREESTVVVVLPEVTRQDPSAQREIGGPSNPDVIEIDIQEQEEAAAIDTVFTPQAKNDAGRKSVSKLKQNAKKETKVEFGRDGSIKNAKTLPMDVRHKYRDKRGSGLFTRADAFKALKKFEDEIESWWMWTPIKLQDGSFSSHGKFGCKACSADIFHLRNIRRHIDSNTHTTAKETKERAVAKKLGPAKILQERLKKYIDIGAKITPEQIKRRKAAVRAAAKANISIAALKELEDTEYVNHSDNPPPSIGDCSHLASDAIPIVHVEDLIILRDILRPTKKAGDKAGDDRVNMLAYKHFSVIFDGTPSFAEAEVSVFIFTLELE